MKGAMPKDSQATIGVEFATKTISLPSGRVLKVQIWDTAGQERYRAITSAHYRNSAGALLVYDVTSESSFRNCSKWLDEIRNGAGPQVLVELIGNKVDLLEVDPGARKVSLDEVAEFAREQGLQFSAASAATGQNVAQIFDHLIQEIHSRNPAAQRPPGGMKIGANTNNSFIPGQEAC